MTEKNSKIKQSNAAKKRRSPRRIVFTSLMIALGASLSIYPGSIPLGPTKVFPFQHMINGITGVMLGPLNAAIIATGIALLRIVMGTGTVFAFVGGVPGAIVVGLFYRYFIRNDVMALTEPIGTVIGALLSALLVSPLMGMTPFPPFLGLTAQWELFTIFFLMSSIPGTLLGYAMLVILRRSGLIARMVP